MLKKLFFLALISVFVFSLVGCGSSNSSNSTISSGETTTMAITNISPYAINSRGMQTWSLPEDLELNVTFDNFYVSTDKSTWVTIIDSPITVNLFDTATLTSTGTNVSVAAPVEGESYRYLKMSISAITMVQGSNSKDLMAIMAAQSGGVEEDWNAITMSILPFTYTGGDIHLNIYMPDSNISGSSFDDYFPVEGPQFTFIGGGVADDLVASLKVTIAAGVGADDTVLIAAGSNIDSGPEFTGTLTNAGDGSASGTFKIPGGTEYIIWAIATSDKSIGVNGPTSGNFFTISGDAPWHESGIAYTANTSPEVTLILSSYEASSGGSPEEPETGTATLSCQVQVDEPITLTTNANLMLYAFDNVDSYSSSAAPTYFLGALNVDAGTFTSATFTVSNLAAGNYVLVAFLDTDNNGEPGSGDYFGVYGAVGAGTPEVITVSDDESVDITKDPIELGLTGG